MRDIIKAQNKTTATVGRMEKMKKYYTADREAGNLIEAFNTYEEAKQAILAYEEQDKADGTYEENFYAVVDEDRCTVE